MEYSNIALKPVRTSHIDDDDSDDAFHRGVDKLIKTGRDIYHLLSTPTPNRDTESDHSDSPNGNTRSSVRSFITSSKEEVDTPKGSVGPLDRLFMNSSLNGSSRVLESNFHQLIGQQPSTSLSGTPDQIEHVLSGQEILNQIGIDNIDLKSLSLEATHELSNRPKIGEIHNSVTANLEDIKKRLAYLSISKENLSIDQAIEIADASYLLKILGRSEEKIELAGKLAYNGSLLMLQANIIVEKGNQLFAQSKRLLQLADLMPSIIPMDHKKHGHSRNRSI